MDVVLSCCAREAKRDLITLDLLGGCSTVSSNDLHLDLDLGFSSSFRCRTDFHSLVSIDSCQFPSMINLAESVLYMYMHKKFGGFAGSKPDSRGRAETCAGVSSRKPERVHNREGEMGARAGGARNTGQGDRGPEAGTRRIGRRQWWRVSFVVVFVVDHDGIGQAAGGSGGRVWRLRLPQRRWQPVGGGVPWLPLLRVDIEGASALPALPLAGGDSSTAGCGDAPEEAADRPKFWAQSPLAFVVIIAIAAFQERLDGKSTFFV